MYDFIVAFENRNFQIWTACCHLNTVGIQLTDMSGNRMAMSSPLTEWSGNQMARLRDYIPTIQLPDI